MLRCIVQRVAPLKDSISRCSFFATVPKQTTAATVKAATSLRCCTTFSSSCPPLLFPILPCDRRYYHRRSIAATLASIFPLAVSDERETLTETIHDPLPASISSPAPSPVEKATISAGLSFYWQLLSPHSFYILTAMASNFIAAFANIRISFLLGTLANLVTSAFSSQQNSIALFYAPALSLIGAYGVQAIATFVSITSLSVVGERIAVHLRLLLFEALVKIDRVFFDQHRTAEMMVRLSEDVQDFKSSFKMTFSTGLRSTTQLIGGIAAILSLSTSLTAVLLLIVPSVIAVGTTFGSVLRRWSRLAQDQSTIALSFAEDALSNITTVKAFAAEKSEIDRFSSDLTSFLVSTQSIQRSLSQLSVLFGIALKGAAAGQRVYDYIQLRPSIPIASGSRIQDLNGEIIFDRISFRYPTRPETEALSKFFLKIPAGRIVALCGPSGSGKSTVAALLERFYDPSSGSIRIDGVDIRDLDLSWLRGSIIGYINQEPALFAGTIMENIRYGCPGASDEEVYHNARLANAHDFISRLPQGYETKVGQRGSTLSGGQKQRIAIARALLKNPKILILDEATSALDSESERLVQEALERVMKGRSVLVIAHRLSTIQNADLIAVLMNGSIVESGTHAQLIKQNGIYTKLVQGQLLGS